MLSTKHLLDLDKKHTARSNALTSANGLRFSLKITEPSSFTHHARSMCIIGILEQIANGKEVPDPGVNTMDIENIRPYLPIVLRPMTCLLIHQFDLVLLQVFREAYLEVVKLYPKLEVSEEK